MLPKSLRKDLNIAVETAMLFCPKNIKPLELAKRILASDRELIEKVQECLVLDRLVSLINRKLTAKQPKLQLELVGFERLPYRISIHGDRMVLRDATLSQLLSYKDVLEKQEQKHKAKLDPLDRLIKLVAPYHAQKPNITVGAVMVAEKRKRDLRDSE